jgi:DNA polymerase-3 subunit alpha
MAGIKNVGSNAVENIIAEREKNGLYKDIFDFVSRVNLNAVNKKNIEALAFAGALDCFKELQRPQYFLPTQDSDSFVEALIRFGNNVQSSSNGGMTLFGEMESMAVSNPQIPTLDDFDMLKFLDAEKEHIGMYVSGHPLEPFKYVINAINTKELRELDDESNQVVDREFKIVGFITEVTERMTKNGKPYGRVSIIDYTGSFTFTLFGKDYLENKNMLVKGYSVLIVARYQEGFSDKSQRYFGVSKVMMLSEIKENYFSKLTITLPIENVTDELIGDITKLLKKNKGNININFQLYSENNKTAINLFSRTERVSLSDEIIDFLENNPFNLKVSLN